MKFTSYLMCIGLMPCFAVNAQQVGGVANQVVYVDGIKSLKVGENMPEALIEKILNSQKKSAKISDFKDQLLILDMWHTGCSGCVAGLPKRDKLQKKFGDRVKILAITPQDEKLVAEFWKTNKYTKDISLPTVVEDRLLYSYFKAKNFYPQVWIYKGKIIGNTDPEYVDEYNIQQVLDGNIPNWPIMSDEYTVNGQTENLFTLNNKLTDQTGVPRMYSAISGYLQKNGVNASRFFANYGIVRDSASKTIKITFTNMPIYSIYFLAWLDIIKMRDLVGNWSAERSKIWEVADKGKYFFDYQARVPGLYFGDWVRENGICFETVMPDRGQSKEEINRHVVSELNRMLGLNVRWEKRKEKVWVLYRTSKIDKIKAKPSSKTVYDTEKGLVRKIRNSPLQNIEWWIMAEEKNPDIINETNYNDYVDMDLKVADWTNINDIKKALKPYDLDIKEEDRMLDKFVFTEITQK